MMVKLLYGMYRQKVVKRKKVSLLRWVRKRRGFLGFIYSSSFLGEIYGNKYSTRNCLHWFVFSCFLDFLFLFLTLKKQKQK